MFKPTPVYICIFGYSLGHVLGNGMLGLSIASGLILLATFIDAFQGR